MQSEKDVYCSTKLHYGTKVLLIRCSAVANSKVPGKPPFNRTSRERRGECELRFFMSTGLSL